MNGFSIGSGSVTALGTNQAILDSGTTYISCSDQDADTINQVLKLMQQLLLSLSAS